MIRKTLLLALCAALLCAFAALAETPEIPPESSDGETYLVLDENASPAASSAPVWTYPISREILDDPLDVLRLVNADTLLDKTYPPSDDLHELVKLSVRRSSSSAMQGRAVAADALQAMFDAADADGIKLYLHSAYRAYRTQEVMHYNRVQSVGHDDGVVQKPGASDHQTGLGFDVISKAWIDRKLNEGFAKTDEAQWMAANCARFGFIIRYPEGKKETTGIMFEPWHLRYVGQEAAVYIMANGLTLEEFTLEWRQAVQAYEAGETPSENTDLFVSF